jgi:hypothetical protein
MHLPTRRLAALACALVVVAGCGSTNPTQPASASGPASPVGPVGSASVLPVPVSQEFGIGKNRVVFSLLDATGTASAATPDRTLAIGYRGPNGEIVPSAPMTFMWAVEGVKGVYVGHATFATAGQWIADFTTAAPGSPQTTVSFSFSVKERTQVLAPGDSAPSVKTPTLADVGGDVTKISTDATPEKRFYQTSEADALKAKKPFVLIFATPKFCRTATCGPALDRLKPLAAAHPEMTFINVEPYQLQEENGALQPVLDSGGELVPVDATNAFRLQSEPFVFVVGADGKVAASFELVFSPEEVEAAVKTVEAG